MDQFTKDLIDAVAKLAGLAAVLAAVFGAWLQLRRWQEDRERSLNELKRSNEQRAEELRWRKASLARDAMGDMYEDALASAAMRMLDWDDREYEVAEHKKVKINKDHVYAALRTDDLEFDDTESYIRDCFDALFGHYQMMEHFLGINLLEAEDVRFPASYYAAHLADNKPVFENFLGEYKYDLALRFLGRLPEWNQPEPAAAPRATPGRP